MRYFYDTEFVDDGRTIDLISIGIAAEDGREYYAVSDEVTCYPLHDKICRHNWLMLNVVPHLPLKMDALLVSPNVTGDYGLFELDSDHPAIKPREVIAGEVAAFLLAEDAPELYAWYAAYDHVALAQLWGPMSQLPAGIPMWTHDLRSDLERLGGDENMLPTQEGGLHNALADARWNRLIYELMYSR